MSAVLGDAAGLLRAAEPGVLPLHEKGGKRYDSPGPNIVCPRPSMPYVETGGFEEPKAALFQSVDPAGRRADGSWR